MIKAYAVNGLGREALALFKMMTQKTKPNSVTFQCVLNACSHAGLVFEAQEVLLAMKEFGTQPEASHFTCLIDALCRVGRLQEAEEMTESSGVTPDLITWMILLSACRWKGEAERAQRCGERALALATSKEEEAAIHVVLAKTYAAARQWEQVEAGGNR